MSKPDITPYLEAIENAVYGKEVRGSIHDAIKAVNDYADEFYTDAKEQAEAAASSATAAAGSATASAGHASDSANSATASANSATASAGSATASAGSATASANSATESAGHASDSANSATAAANAATAAANSASTASQKAGEAATSAQAAAAAQQSFQNTIVDNLNSNDSDKALSAKQGKLLNEKIEANAGAEKALRDTAGYKNLNHIPKPYDFEETTNNGVTYTVNENGTIRLSGGTAAGVTSKVTIAHDIQLGKENYTIPYYLCLQNCETSEGYVSDEKIKLNLKKQGVSYATRLGLPYLECEVDSSLRGLYSLELQVEPNTDLSSITLDVYPVLSDEKTIVGELYYLSQIKQDKLNFDNSPTAGSNNPVKSKGIKAALDNKQDTLTFDNTPTKNSNNPVKSGGIKTALDAKQNDLGLYIEDGYICQSISS